MEVNKAVRGKEAAALIGVAAVVVVGGIWLAVSLTSPSPAQTAPAAAAAAPPIERMKAQLQDATADSKKVALMECLGIKVYQDPQPAGHPPPRAACDAIVSAAQRFRMGPEIEHLIAQWHSYNTACRDIPEAAHSCENRDDIGKYLGTQGWCYGHDPQPMSDRKWEFCQ